MKARHKRLAWIVVAVLLFGSAVTLVLNAFQENLVFFHTPSEIAAGKIPQGRNLRIGGLVETGSLRREADGVTVHFMVTDTAKSVRVTYKGALPDLFREGRGAVMQGKLGPDGTFTASEVLAKHDENYMPPEAKDAIDKARQAAKTLRP
ncbi:MAG TPA: cytochrome c maturation protein CcmE [Rhodocyclaceae bacterium]|nr:cytochrome c maturation protein CcmE [Rhodocyclaceae bacterium]